MPERLSVQRVSPSTLRRFVALLASVSPARTFEAIGVTLGLTLVEGVGLLLLIPLLQLVGIETGQDALGGIMGAFARAFRGVGIVPTLPIVLGIYVATVAVQSLLQRRQSAVTALLQRDVTAALRARVYRAVASAKWEYLARTRATDFTHVLTGEVDRAGQVAYYATDLAATATVSLAYVALALRVSPAMTMLALFAGAILAVGVRGRMESARQTGEQVSSAWRRLHAAIGEHLASMKMAKGYGVEPHHAQIFERRGTDLDDVYLEAVVGNARVRQWLAVGSAAVLAVVVFVAHDVLHVPSASLVLLLYIFARLVPRFTSLYEKARAMAVELPAFEAVLEVEARCLKEAATAPSAQRPIALNDRLELDRVTFDYGTGSQRPALQRASLTIPARATTAIVGPSGAGKSTVADLLMGLLEPASGRVLVDGQPLASEHLRSWRSQIGYVPQDTFLFHETVRANLTWARPDAADEEIWRALDMASATDFVRGLPAGLDTLVGDRGVLVSGGERQRLSLARALLRQPKVLILDEATSSLDSESERRIQLAIDHLHEQMTIVVITHRLSTVRNADLVHVVEQGRVVESGTWAELAASPASRFRDLCDAQGVDCTPELVERRLQVFLG